jgi:hypothetical protein
MAAAAPAGRRLVIWISAAHDAATCPPAGAISPWHVDEFLDTYVSWREASAAAKDAYESWTRAGDPERKLGFAAYHAALDGEEAAARAYRKCVERIVGPAR